jgi:multidrug efflux pump subunit AcrA (membrane-fusion protein)
MTASRHPATGIQVSADRVVDQRSGVLGRHVALLPGMPAVATIATRRRTVLDYLPAPIYDGLDRAMREQ